MHCISRNASVCFHLKQAGRKFVNCSSPWEADSPGVWCVASGAWRVVRGAWRKHAYISSAEFSEIRYLRGVGEGQPFCLIFCAPGDRVNKSCTFKIYI